MRIISGYLKGKKILEPKNKITRPLKDMVKESIFNIIKHSNKFDIEINNSIILDLYSGIGSFGLEAISRGSLKVIFVENYSEALTILKKNIKNLGVGEKSTVLENDIYSKLDLQKFDSKFDIIFLDPPYKEKLLSTILEKIFNSKILNKDGLIIIHRHKNEIDNSNEFFNIIEEKVYGVSKLIFGNFI